VPREISTPGADGKRVRRQKWLINIEAQPDWVELQLAAAAEAARPVIAATPSRLELPAWDEDEDEAGSDSRPDQATNGEMLRPLPQALIEKSVSHPQAVPAQSDASLALEVQLKQACMTIWNGDKVRAAEHFAREFAGLGFEPRQEALLTLNSPATEKLITKLDDQIMARARSWPRRVSGRRQSHAR
jgi:hypothetical protein